MKYLVSIGATFLALFHSGTGLEFTVNRSRMKQPVPVKVEFKSGSLMLRGFVNKPSGKGPFPVMIWNHGSEEDPSLQPELAEFYTKNGYLLFLPHRHGQGLSPGTYIVDILEGYKKNHSADEYRKEAVRQHEIYLKDVLAAIDFIRTKPYVRPNRIYMSGGSFGGIQTLLAAEKGHHLKAVVPFAPGAQSWDNEFLRERLSEASKNAKIPMFIIQARNDYDIGPSLTLGPIVLLKGSPNGFTLFPPFGPLNDPQSGHGKFAITRSGIGIWGDAVLRFLQKVG